MRSAAVRENFRLAPEKVVLIPNRKLTKPSSLTYQRNKNWSKLVLQLTHWAHLNDIRIGGA
jgi:hypothetical protein